MALSRPIHLQDLDALLAAIQPEPHDDQPRLALADWLEEHGQEARAEFIRVQCALEPHCVELTREIRCRSPYLLPSVLPERVRLELEAKCASLVEREKQLLAAHRAEWLTGLPTSHFSYEFHRGMIRLNTGLDPRLYLCPSECCPEEVRDREAGLVALDHLAVQPEFAWVVEVVFDASGDCNAGMDVEGEDFALLLTHPALRHVTCLRLGWMLGSSHTFDLTPLAGRRDLERLTELYVSAGNHQYGGYVDARALWAFPALPNLRQLAFTGPYDEGDYLPLAESSYFPRLQSLTMSFNHERTETDGGRVLRAFAESPHFPNLREVALDGSGSSLRYRPLDVLALLRSPRLTGLEFVEFDFAVEWEEWVDVWASGDGLPSNAVGFVAALTEVAAACQNVDQTRRVACGIDLLLRSLQFDAPADENRYRIKRPGPIPADLSNTWLGDAVLTGIADSPHLAGVTSLNLSGNRIGDEGAAALADSPHAAELQHLNVSGNQLSDDSLRRLRERFAKVVCAPPSPKET